MWRLYGGQPYYKTQMLNLISNLPQPHNEHFITSLLLNERLPEGIAVLTSSELASNELSQQRQQARKEDTKAHIMTEQGAFIKKTKHTMEIV